MTDPADTASISFTGLYTGEVWHRNGLAPGFLATSTGGVLYHLMSPFEWASLGVGGNNLRVVLMQRHLVMDHLLETLIREAGVNQVLEIASGMSPRGYRFRRRFPSLAYVETDMPQMARRKRQQYERAGCTGDARWITSLNAFHETGEQALENVVSAWFTEGQPLVVITEGLTSYFTLEAIQPFWRRLAGLGKRFPGSRYLMETYFLPDSGWFRGSIERSASLLGRLSDSSVSFHFRDDAEVRDCFSAQGFARTLVHDPADYYDWLPIPRSRGRTLVRVVEAELP